MDLKKVIEVINLLQESGVAEIEVRDGDKSIRVSQATSVAVNTTVPAVNPALPEPPAAPQAAQAVAGTVVRAPMVGTFYRAQSPGSPAFVEVGDRITSGQVLCIIESMKMMNEVKSEVSGKLEAVLVDNESSVEFDQPLFTIV